MKSREFELIIKKVLQLIDEGVHVIDTSGNSIIYNDAMARLEKMRSKDVLRKPFSEVFRNINSEESTMLQALIHNKTTMHQQQTYHNKDGKEITTINSTVPVMDGDKIIAAIEIAKNITNIKEMSHTILDLHKEKLEPYKVKEKRIKKYNFDNLIGQNNDFKEIISTARKAAKSAASVFIYGETGTGKELIAQSIHFDSERRDKPFLAQNCAALPESLLEGILFGTSKGGFTGAVDRAGLFEQADGGTLLLDEISAMPYGLQGKLLRVLQEDYIRRIGGEKDIPIDVRIIATINEKAEILMSKGALRKDLYYRLNIIEISIMPLRERQDDIILLAEKFLEKHNKKNNKHVWMISDRAKEKLLNYNYPGNVRELENIIMAALSMVEDENVLTEDHILINNIENSGLTTSFNYRHMGLDEHLEKVERAILEASLINNNYNISKTAQQLNLKRQTLQHKIKKYNIEK